MGDNRLTRLPRTRKWQQVVGLLGSGAGTGEIAAVTLAASERGLEEGNQDPGLVHSFWLLTQIPLCARSEDFAESLRLRGIQVAGDPSLVELIGAYTDAVDAHLRRTGGRTDLGEMAQLAAAESLSAVVGALVGGLFDTRPDNVREELGGLGTKKQFGRLARDFFARLMRRYLSSFLSREIANHVGGGERFADVDGHVGFSAALNLHCQEAAHIVEDFAGGWFSKTDFEGGITPEKAAGFMYVALRKLRGEMAKRGMN